MKKSVNSFYNFIIWICAIICGGIYLSLCFNHNVWADEAYSMNLIKCNFSGIITGTSGDVHPPLYYLIAKLAATVFPTYRYRLLVQKIVVIIPMVCTLGFGGAWLGKHEFGKASILWFFTVIVCLPCLMEYAVQIRMYSWALFFVTLAGMKAYDTYNNCSWSNWIELAIFSLLSGYTHYYALVSCFVIYVFLFLILLVDNRMALVKWLVSGLCVALLYAPWLYVLFTQFSTINGNYWIPYIDSKVVLGYFDWTFGNNWKFTWIVLTILLIALGVYCLINTIRFKNKEDFFANTCWMVPFSTMCFGVIVSRLTSPVYYNRYIVPSLGLLALGIGISLRKTTLKNPFILVCLCFSLILGAESYRENFVSEYLNPNVPQFEQFLEANLEPNDIVVYNFQLLDYCYEYYIENQNQIMYIEDVDLQMDFDDIWFLHTSEIPDYKTFSEDDLLSEGLVMDYIGKYGLEDTSFDIYRIHR